MCVSKNRTPVQASDSNYILGLLATTALVGVMLVSPAYAADVTSASPLLLAQASSAQATGGQARIAFNIPAQSLAAALSQFGRQSGLQVTAPGAMTAGLQSPGVSGEMMPGEALTRLLGGTGLSWRQSDAQTIILVEAPKSGATVLPAISVQGDKPLPPQAEIGNLMPEYPGGQAARGGKLGVLGNRDIMDTPFNQVSYTAKKIEDQHARVLSDVLVDHPSAQIMSSRGGSNVDLFSMRGFTYQSITFGGLPGILGSDNAMPELAERVEVLTGPSAMLNGTLGMGGTLNVIPKRAPEESLARLTPSYGSTGNLGGHADIAHRFGRDKELGVRFNGVYRDGETAVKDVFDQRSLASLGVDYRGERLRLAADLGYQEQDQQGVIPRIQVNGTAPVPKAPRSDRNPGAPWTYKDNQDKFAVLRGELDVTDNLTAYAAAGHHEWQRSFLNNRLTVTNANGDGTLRTVLSNFTEKTDSSEAGFRGRFDTGPVEHEFVVGGLISRTVSGVGETSPINSATNLYSPAATPEPNLALPQTKPYLDTELSSIVIADTLSVLDKRVQLTLGVRQQTVDATNFVYNNGAPNGTQSETLLSPSVALVVKPLENVSLYGNVIQGLEAGEVVPTGYTNTGTVFPPYKTKQYEAGIKFDWGGWTTTASVFQITRPSAIDDTSTTPSTRVIDGEQRNRGLELSILGEPLDGVRLLGGAMILDPELTKTQGGTNDGRRAPNSSELQLKLAGEWDMPFVPGLALTGRVIYVSEQYIDTSTRRLIPDWTRVDVGARYTFEGLKSPTGKPIVVRFNVDNVMDKDYWMSSNFSQLNLAAPRTFWLSTTFDF